VATEYDAIGGKDFILILPVLKLSPAAHADSQPDERSNCSAAPVSGELEQSAAAVAGLAPFLAKLGGGRLAPAVNRLVSPLDQTQMPSEFRTVDECKRPTRVVPSYHNDDFRFTLSISHAIIA
jgi:hypothetical protein